MCFERAEGGGKGEGEFECGVEVGLAGFPRSGRAIERENLRRAELANDGVDVFLLIGEIGEGTAEVCELIEGENFVGGGLAEGASLGFIFEVGEDECVKPGNIGGEFFVTENELTLGDTQISTEV